MTLILTPGGKIEDCIVISEEELHKMVNKEIPPIKKLTEEQEEKNLSEYYTSINPALQEMYQQGHHMDISGFPTYVPRTDEQEKLA